MAIVRIIEERLKWGQRFGHIYQLFVEVVVGLFQFEGGGQAGEVSLAKERRRSEKLPNYR